MKNRNWLEKIKDMMDKLFWGKIPDKTGSHAEDSAPRYLGDRDSDRLRRRHLFYSRNPHFSDWL